MKILVHLSLECRYQQLTKNAIKLFSKVNFTTPFLTMAACGLMLDR